MDDQTPGSVETLRIGPLPAVQRKKNHRKQKGLPGQITETVEELKRNGLTFHHQSILPQRLGTLWRGNGVSRQTNWRRRIAVEAMSKVQKKSAHLFFVLVLLVSTTTCGQKGYVEENINPLLDKESYNDYEFSLPTKDRLFMEDIEQKHGLGEIPNFITLKQALFQNNQSMTAPRSMLTIYCHLCSPLTVGADIEYAYGRMLREHIPLFLQTVAPAIEMSNLCWAEEKRGDNRTDAVTLLVPEGDVDCSVVLAISRNVALKMIGTYGLTQIHNADTGLQQSTK